MNVDPKDQIEAQVAAHAAADSEQISHLRGLSMAERARLIEAACRAAASLLRDRAAAGLPLAEAAAWPQSTWDFLRYHADRVRDKSTD